MSRTRKLVLTTGAGLVGLVLLALVAGVLTVRSSWFSEQVRQGIVREVETATGGRVEIGEFQFSGQRMRATVRPFVLHGTEPAGEAPLLSAASVEVGLKIISAFRRKVDIESLTVAEPRVHLIVDEDGRTNLPQPVIARQRKQPVEQFLDLAIDTFQITNGAIDLNERRIPLELRGENLTSRLFYEVAGPRYAGTLSFRRLHVATGVLRPVALSVDSSLSLEANRLVVREARVATDRSSGVLSGTVENLLAPRVDVAIKANASLTELQALAKMPAYSRGTVDFSGKFSWSGASTYNLAGQAFGRNLSVDAGGIQISPVSLRTDLKLSPDGVELTALSVSALGGDFQGGAHFEKSRRFRAAGDLTGLRASALAPLRKLPEPPWDGRVSGPVVIDGAFAAGKPRDVNLSAKLAVEAVDGQRPLSGAVNLTLSQRDATLRFEDSHLSTAASRLEFQGSPDERLRIDLETTDFNDLLPAAAYLSKAAPKTLPVALQGGTARFAGDVTGGLKAPRLSGHASVTGLAYQDQKFDRLEAEVIVSETRLEASKLTLEQRGAVLQGQGRAALQNWRVVDASQISGSFTARGVPLERVAAEIGTQIAVRGSAEGTFQAAGTLGSPQVKGKFSVSKAQAFGWTLDRAVGQFSYHSRAFAVEAFELVSGQTRLRGSLLFTAVKESFKEGTLRFDLSGKNLRLTELRRSAPVPDDLDGTLDGEFRGALTVQQSGPLLTELLGTASLRKIAYKGRPAGELQWSAARQGDALAVAAGGNAFGMKIKAQGSVSFENKNPVRGELSFSRVSLAELRPWLTLAGIRNPPLEGSADGTVYFTGSLLDPNTWSARVEMPSVEILPPAGTKAAVPGLRNVGLVVLTVNRKGLRIVSGSFAGPDTNLNMGGQVDFSNRINAFDLRVRGSINLGILQNFDPNVTATGDAFVDATVRGPRSRPEFYGRVEFKKASLFLSNVPNGVDNAAGVILLFRDRATIENITAETGGGKVAAKGFIGFGTPQLSYRLQATASNVRVRYPEGVSTSVDAQVDLTGTSARSLLSGSVTILRSGVSAGVDLAGLLARASRPMVTPATKNELLRGMQFDVRVAASPNARFDTMLTRDIQAEADMRLRGTPYKPVLLGRVTVNQGEVNFLGNRYTISRGEVSFLNPVRLEPVLNLDLETRVRGVDVILSFTGPADRLNLSYRSDPPLQIQEIIALLALGRAPTSDPALLARQSQQNQSWQQLGASTLVGQALAAPVASRLERFFGVSRIKIDPSLTGLGNNPEAQLTLEQQVSKDITFTYVTRLAQEQQQLVRIEWNVSRQWSLLAVRDENGLFGIEVQFRRQFR